MTVSHCTYEIIRNPLGQLPLRFTTYLFNEVFYIRQQVCDELNTFYLVHKRSKQAYARFTLCIRGNSGYSPGRGTFGSIEAASVLLQDDLDLFVDNIDNFAIERGLEQMFIKLYPLAYAPELASSIAATLLRHGYTLLPAEINYHIPVSQTGFANQIHISEKRKIKKCAAAGFIAEEESEPDLPRIYEMIVQTRHRRNFPVSLQYTEFEQLFIQFPHRYKIFTVKNDAVIIACTVAVIINSKIMYYFLPADEKAYRSFSPMVLLIKCLYEYCQKHKFDMLDLGISTDKGVPNYGLMRFKQNLGAKPSLKFSFVKTFIT